MVVYGAVLPETSILADEVGRGREFFCRNSVLPKGNVFSEFLLAIALAQGGTIATSAVVMDINVVVRCKGAAEKNATGMNITDSVAVDFSTSIDPNPSRDPGIGFRFAFFAIGIGREVFDDVVADDVARIGARIGIVGSDGDGTTVAGSAVANVIIFDDDGGDLGLDFNALSTGTRDVVPLDQDAMDRGGAFAIADVNAFGIVLFLRIAEAVEAGMANGVMQDLDIFATWFDGDRLLPRILD